MKQSDDVVDIDQDDDIFDEDLPVEPLEAPDEGPETFEGEILLPDLDLPPAEMTKMDNVMQFQAIP